MTRIERILERVGDSLFDPEYERYTLSRRLRLVEEAQEDIAIHANILRAKVYLPVAIGSSEYVIPQEVIRYTRVLYNNKSIELVSHNEMDALDPCWETHTGPEICKVVYDLTDLKRLRVYPILNEDAPSTIATFSSLYGVATAGTNVDVSDDYGVASDIVNPDLESYSFSSDYGVIVGFVDLNATLQIRYLRFPNSVESVNTELETPRVFDKAIQHYVVGKCLRDDLDSANRIKGNEELTYYQRELAIAMRVDQRDGTRAHQFDTHYKPMGD